MAAGSEREGPADVKKCPYCAEEIQDEAVKCRYCYSDLTVPREEAIAMRPGSEKATESGPEQASGPPGAAVVASSDPGADPSGPETSDVPTAGATSTDASGGADASPVRYSHSGYKFVLGFGADFFGIWDRQSPESPVERFPRTDEGWRDAWVRFSGMEPHAVEVPSDGGSGASPTAAAGAAGSTGAGEATYTHTGTRYLLGYGSSYFGIWDRQRPGEPVERFSRTDEGWGQAWRRYTQIESNYAEVR